MIEQKTAELLEAVEGRVALMRERRAFLEKADVRLVRAKKGTPEHAQAVASQEKRKKDLADSRKEAQDLIATLTEAGKKIQSAIQSIKKEKP